MTTGYGDGAERGADAPRTESGGGQEDPDYDPYRAAVDALHDPLTDPLPGQRAPASPAASPSAPAPAAPAPASSPAPAPAPTPVSAPPPASAAAAASTAQGEPVPGASPAPAPDPDADADRPFWAQEAAQEAPFWAHEAAQPRSAQPHAAAPYAASGYETRAYESPTYEGSPYGSHEATAPGAPASASFGAPAYERRAPQQPQPQQQAQAHQEQAQQDRGTVGLRRPRETELARRAVSRTAAAPPAPPGRALPERLPGPTRLEARRAARALRPGPGIIASRAIGEVFITCGVLMLLFVAYQLWWTNVRANQQAGGATHDLQEQWGDKKPKKKGMDPERKAGAFKPGQGFAIIHIPKIDVTAPIAEGVSKSAVLDKGMVGHYYKKPLKTAMPWEKEGNFALAGHRNTHGEPFRYINKLAPGDMVVVETQSKFYTYKVTRQLPSTSPSDTGVIDRVPPKSGFTKPGRYVTLTTCTPEFTSKYRLIVWGKMVDERPRSKGKPDALIE
ncbi:class E sortase [Streptomyces axinellae]|uniref:Class E sortase n=1 Tax=Streptomyces axinellae TaxID=552788 RepID=A0ABN3Q108_9ACTN